MLCAAAARRKSVRRYWEAEAAAAVAACERQQCGDLEVVAVLAKQAAKISADEIETSASQTHHKAAAHHFFGCHSLRPLSNDPERQQRSLIDSAYITQIRSACAREASTAMAKKGARHASFAPPRARFTSSPRALCLTDHGVR